jgi:hypothetical protein
VGHPDGEGPFLEVTARLALDENTTFDILEHNFLQMDIVRR